MPFPRWRSIKPFSSFVSVIPMLKSPSVAKITRLTAVGVEVLLGHGIGLANALRPGRAAAGLEAIERSQNLRLLRHGCRLEHGSGLSGVGDDGDAIVRIELRQQHRQGLLDERQPVWGIHRAGRIDQEHKVGARARGRLDGIALDAEMKDFPTLGPGAREHRDRCSERLGGCRGRFVSVGEVVDEFLRADRGGLGQDVAVE